MYHRMLTDTNVFKLFLALFIQLLVCRFFLLKCLSRKHLLFLREVGQREISAKVKDNFAFYLVVERGTVWRRQLWLAVYSVATQII